MNKNITTKYENSGVDMYVDLASDLYDLCQKYGNCGTVDEVIHHNVNFDKIVNELQNFIIKHDTPTSKREKTYREIARLLSTSPDSITEGNPNGFVDSEKYEKVMDRLELVENNIHDFSYALGFMWDLLEFIYNSDEELYNKDEATKLIATFNFTE